MNKAIAATLTAALLLSMGTTTVFAADNNTVTGEDVTKSEGNTKTTQLSYTVQSTYTWTVPREIKFTNDQGTLKSITGTATDNDGSVTVSGCTIPYNNELTITVEGSGDKNNEGHNAFTITTGDGTKKGAELSYTVKSSAMNNAEVTTGGTVLTMDAGTAAKNAELTFTLATDYNADSGISQKSGTYTGTATFTATVAEKSSN